MSSPFPLPQEWGWDLSRYVPVPDQFFYAFLPHLSPSEKSVLLYIFRRTLGFRKTQDAISLNQLLKGIPGKDGGTGLHRETLRRAIKSLLAKRLLRRQPNKAASGRDLPSCYSLPVASPCPIRPLDPAESAQAGAGKYRPSEGLSNPPPQDTEIQRYTREVYPESAHAWADRREAATARAACPPLEAGEPPLTSTQVGARHVVPLHPQHRWATILAWWNEKCPLEQCTPHERRLAYREMERLVRDPDFAPPASGWRPPTFEEALKMAGVEPKG